MLDEDLRDKILWIVGPNVSVEMNKISEDITGLAVFFARRGSNTELFTDGTPILGNHNYDIEVYGEDIDNVELLALSLFSGLNGYQGYMGLTFVHSAFATNHEDNYQSKVLLNTDSGLHISTFQLEIVA